MREINEKMYQTTDGDKFFDRDEAEQHQLMIDETVFYEVTHKEYKIHSEAMSHSEIGLNYNNNESLESLVSELGLIKEYVGVRTDYDQNTILMIEEFMYEQFGGRIGHIEGKGRYTIWEYKRVSVDKVFDDEVNGVSYIDEKGLSLLRRRNEMIR